MDDGIRPWLKGFVDSQLKLNGGIVNGHDMLSFIIA